jgi:tetratricopeptide (TPR) repeat protein
MSRFERICLRRLLFIALCMLPLAAHAQATGAIRGHATNPAGQPITSGVVRLTIDHHPQGSQRTYSFSFPVDGSGNYRGDGIVPANYLAVLFDANGKSIDFIDNVLVTTGQTLTVDFDMTRQEYIDKMTPEERQALEKYKEQARATQSVNSQIQQLNNLLVQARAKTKDGQFEESIALMQTATQLKSDEPILWITLGDAQLGLAKNSATAAKKAGRTPTSMPEVVQQYEEAATSYRKGITLNAAKSTPSPETAATAWNQVAQAMGEIGRTKEAAAAYEQAIAADPAREALYAYNEAATLYNAEDGEGAGTAARRSIAADPTRPDAYYILAQSLIQKATVNPKTSQIQLPPGCLDAYKTYLRLAPSGTRADEVQAILSSLGKSSTSQQASVNTPAPRVARSESPAARTPSPAPSVTDRGLTPTAPPDQPHGSPLPIPHNYALIFATDNYAHWPHLQNPVSDAGALNDTLTSLYGFQVEELKNPTGEQILQKLTEYLHRPFEIQDQLMIVFSGHGYFDSDLGQGFIAPADALRVEDDLGHRSLLSHETIMNYVNRIPSKHVVLVIDACFAGTLDRKIADSGLRGSPSDVYAHASLPELLLRKESKRTRRYFASGGKDFVPDGLPGHHSPFISAFLVTLNQAADRKGYATLDDLQEGLNTVNPEPRWGDIQGDNDPGADFLLLTPSAISQLSKTN